MRIYLDSSALIKRAIDEDCSDPLTDALERVYASGSSVFASSLAWVEVSRGMRTRLDAEPPAKIAELSAIALSAIDRAPINSTVIALARQIGPPGLRLLDAIHLATASILEADELWAYDDRLLAAASELGIAVRSPGRPE